MPLAWRQILDSEKRPPAVVDSRRRLRFCMAALVVLLLVVFGRTVQLEVTQGAAFREEVTKPLRRQKDLPGVRGRILARDGTVLACDEKVRALSVYYRHLEEPPDPRWLRKTAGARLTRRERKDPDRLAAEEARLEEERQALARRLARLCGLSEQEWNGRARTIQTRVERIADRVNRGRGPSAVRESPDQGASPTGAIGKIAQAIREFLQVSLDDQPPAPLVIAEQLDYHVMVDDVPPELVAEIESHPDQYPGVKIVELSRRSYPSGSLAAHVLGYLGLPSAAGKGPEARGQGPGSETGEGDVGYRAGDLVGRTGVEHQYEAVLRGRHGIAVEMTDHGGHVVEAYCEQEPQSGRDVTLTLDARLQRAAEELLDGALQRRSIQPSQAEPAGGAITVIDVRTGAVWAAASAPRFDPNWFAGGDSARLALLLTDKEQTHPLVHRTIQMALPPGSVFKTLTAIALLETSTTDPQEPLLCQGYLHRPEQQRCAIYVRRGVGHGEVTLADALAQSCNVYFFYHAGQMGVGPLVDWANRLGFGRPTGIDLPNEAAGVLPTPETIRRLERHDWTTSDTQTLAIGQGSLTTTPMQIVRMMAAVANGGRLVTPHVVDDDGGRGAFFAPSNPTTCEAGLPRKKRPVPLIPGLSPSTLAAVRRGLEQVVAHPEGTAHGSVYLESIAIAGKTGTAGVGEGHAEHAWFAGYAPADKPRFAFVVVLEHSGDAATTAGPVVKRLVVRMQELGVL